MSFLPIVSRELSVASRRPAVYRVRFWASLGATVIMLAMLATSRRATGQLGHEVFSVLSVLAFIYALLGGVRCTADALSQEKREGTLGLLFLTTLRGYDVVFGKLVVSSLDAAFGLMSILPILSVPVLLGSVTASEFWRMDLLLLNALMFSLALGLVISTFGQQERAVLVGTLLVVLLVTLGLPLVWKSVTCLRNSRWFDFVLLFPSPAYAFKMVSDRGIRTASREYWLSMTTIVGVWMAGLVLSSFALPRLFQEKGPLPQNGSWRRRLHRWRFGDPQFRRFVDEQQIEKHSFQWLVSRDRLTPFSLSGLVLVIVLFALWAPSAFRAPTPANAPIAMFGAFGLHQFCKLLLAAEASRRLNLDKRNGALELLLSTRLSIPSILNGQMRSLQRHFLMPLLGLVLVNWLIFMEIISKRDEMPGLISGVFVLPFDFYALSWLGMLTGLREPRYTSAVFRALGTVMIGPWTVILLFVCANSHRGVSSSTLHSFFFWWFCFTAIYDTVLVCWAKGQLTRRFRRFAANDVGRRLSSF